MASIGEMLSSMFQQSGNRYSRSMGTYTGSQGTIISGMASVAGKIANATVGGDKNQIKESLIEAANKLAEMRKISVRQRGFSAIGNDALVQQQEFEIESQKQNMIAGIMAWFNGQLKINPFEGFKEMMKTALDGAIPTWLYNASIQDNSNTGNSENGQVVENSENSQNNDITGMLPKWVQDLINKKEDK